MIRHRRTIFTLGAGLLAWMAGAAAQANGGFIDLDELGAAFDDGSHQITNEWWPLPNGLRQVYLAVTEDGCELGVLDVLDYSEARYRQTVYSARTLGDVKVREVLDREFEIEDCEEAALDFAALDEAALGEFELLELTLDWYAQDTAGRIWYFGEFSISLDEDDIAECEHDLMELMGEEGCPDGSWEAGKEFFSQEENLEVLEGVIMLAPEELAKGAFYFQEYWEDEATDMAKILNFKDVEAFLDVPSEGCLMTKEWVPLEPGNVEHKYYCHGTGLVQVEGLAGGPTVWTDLVFDSTLD